MQERMPADRASRLRVAPDLPWDDVQIFLAIAETGSLSRAAKRLRVAQPTMSRRLADLEQRVGFALFQRTVAGVALTAAGERLVEPAKRMAEWAAEVTRAASHDASAGPSGVVRVTAPPGVAFDFVAPFARVVRDHYPAVRLEVICSVRVVDLSRGEADLALRLRPSVSRDLVTLGTLTVPTVVVASKAYAAKLPAKPKLAELDWIAWAPPYDDVTPNPELAAAIPDFTPAFTSDDYIVQWRACESGLGAMVAGRRKHRFSLPSSIVPIDVDVAALPSSKLHLVSAKSALGIPRVRAVADLLVDEWVNGSLKEEASRAAR